VATLPPKEDVAAGSRVRSRAPILAMYATDGASMRISIRVGIAVTFLCAAIQGIGAFDVSSLPLHLYLSGLDKATAPVIVEQHLVLSVSGPYRYVGAAFSNEDWRGIHPFEINANGIFVLALPVPYGEAAVVRYRLVLDGLWSADPSNADQERDRVSGSLMSLVRFPERPGTVLGVWEPAREDGASFYFKGEPGRIVTVAGSFNNWDPFIHELEETSPGHYQLFLKLAPGEYQYVFMYRGSRVADPLNQRQVYGRDGQPYSVLKINRPSPDR